ncbi:MAG TPA: tetratricopeptide repeat protein [Polyangia bacterium]|nr:tetratricopeptide repeat protein [Polyangia bacterium]
MYRRSIALAACLVALCCTNAIGAPAPPEKDAGLAEWKQGSVEYALGRFSAAAKHYEEAYRRLQDPALLFNLGQARRLAGQREGALAAYRSYLRTAEPNAPDRDLAQKRIVELEAGGAAAVPLAPAPSDSSSSLLDAPAGSASARSTADEGRTPWWLWGAAGALVVGAGVAAIFVLANRTPDVIGGKDGAVVIK